MVSALFRHFAGSLVAFCYNRVWLQIAAPPPRGGTYIGTCISSTAFNRFLTSSCICAPATLRFVPRRWRLSDAATPSLSAIDCSWGWAGLSRRNGTYSPSVSLQSPGRGPGAAAAVSALFNVTLSSPFGSYVSLPSFPPAGVSASAANLSSPITPQFATPSAYSYSGPFGAEFTLSAWVNPTSLSTSPMTILWASTNTTAANDSAVSYASSAGNATSQLQLYLTPSFSSSGPFVAFSWVSTSSATPWPATAVAANISLADASMPLSLNGRLSLFLAPIDLPSPSSL